MVRRRQAQVVAASNPARAKAYLRTALEAAPGEQLLLEDLLALEERGGDAVALEAL